MQSDGHISIVPSMFVCKRRIDELKKLPWMEYKRPTSEYYRGSRYSEMNATGFRQKSKSSDDTGTECYN